MYFDYLCMIPSLRSIGLAHIGRVGSVAVTVSISVERYLNCCHPNESFKYKSFLLPVPIIFTFLFNIPKFLEISACTSCELFPDNSTMNISSSEKTTDPENKSLGYTASDNFDAVSMISCINSTSFPYDEVANSTLDYISNQTRLNVDDDLEIVNEYSTCHDGYKTTWLRNNWWYIVFYLGWSKFLLVECLPWLIVIILTICTTKSLKNFQVNRDRLMRKNSVRRTNDEGKIRHIFHCKI